MAKYLLQASYTTDGVKGLLKEGGTSRRDAVKKAYRSMGAKVESFYFGFGETDVYVIADVPDNATMAALALNVSASGLVSVKTTALLAPEEIDKAAKKTPSYRPPGQ
jgi:uncharacterized protein with GYD domain